MRSSEQCKCALAVFGLIEIMQHLLYLSDFSGVDKTLFFRAGGGFFMDYVT